MSAQAAEPATLTLACQGTATDRYAGSTDDGKPEPYSAGVIIDFTARTVEGIAFPAKISGVTNVIVTFEGSQDGILETIWTVNGHIDRVTGDLEATLRMRDKKTGKSAGSVTGTVYSLKCRPAQRMF